LVSYELPVQLLDKEKGRKNTQFKYEKWANIKNTKETPVRKRK